MKEVIVYSFIGLLSTSGTKFTAFIFTPVAWPDFDEAELNRCLDVYAQRHRRFGGL